jgi:hypothetical protein
VVGKKKEDALAMNIATGEALGAVGPAQMCGSEVVRAARRELRAIIRRLGHPIAHAEGRAALDAYRSEQAPKGLIRSTIQGGG